MKKTLFLISLIVIVALLSGFALKIKNLVIQNPETVACTMEAKLCPDGSYVGRIGPKCEFAECPSPINIGSGTLNGTMTIGPICPVERIDHPCNPTPEMYAAHKVFIYTADKTGTVATLTPDAEGHFSAELKAGEYFVDVEHQAIGFARISPQTVKIIDGQTVTININIDTGIR